MDHLSIFIINVVCHWPRGPIKKTNKTISRFYHIIHELRSSLRIAFLPLHYLSFYLQLVWWREGRRRPSSWSCWWIINYICWRIKCREGPQQEEEICSMLSGTGTARFPSLHMFFMWDEVCTRRWRRREAPQVIPQQLSPWDPIQGPCTTFQVNATIHAFFFNRASFDLKFDWIWSTGMAQWEGYLCGHGHWRSHYFGLIWRPSWSQAQGYQQNYFLSLHQILKLFRTSSL